MYKVLIADDEARERNILKILLDRHFPEQFTVYEANNGEEVLIQFTQNQPQLIFMDIRMPGINGLNAIKKIRKQTADTYIIILTAYNYFEFAKEAIHERVNDFILKPPARENLIQAVEKFMSTMQIQELNRKHMNETKEKFDQWKEIIKKELAINLIYGDVQSDQRNNYFNILEIKYNWGYCLLFSIEYLGSVFFQKTGSNEKDYLRKICDTIDVFMKDQWHQYTIDILGKYVILFLFIKGEDEKECKKFAMNIADKINKTIESKLHITLKVSMGNGYSRADELYKSYGEAAAKMKSLEAQTGMDTLCELNEESYFLEMESIDYERLIVKKIREGNYKEAIQILSEVVTALHRIHEVDYGLLKVKLIELLSSITKDCIVKEQAFQHLKDMGEIFDLDSMTAIMKFIHNYIQKIVDQVEVQQSKKNHFIIDKVVEYVKSNYEKSLTVEEMSAKFSLNTFYFSKLFKEHQRKNFVDYVAEVRMNKAIELLNNESLNIKEIAYRVGYQDPNYFSRVFKKTVGVSPKDYRNTFL